MNLLYLLFLFELVYVFIAVVISRHNLLSISFISGCCFWLATLCNIVNEEKWKIDFNYSAFLVLTVGQIALLLGEFCAIVIPEISLGIKRKIGIGVFSLDGDMGEELNIPDWKHYALALFNLCFFVLFFATVMQGGLNLQAIALYKEENDGLSNMNIFVQQSFRFLIACSIFYAFLIIYNVMIYNSFHKRDFVFCIYTNLLACLESILAASRRNIIVILVAWFVIYIVLDNARKGWKNEIPVKTLKKIAIFLCVLMVIFRNLHGILKSSASNLETLFDYVTYYIGCPIQTLNVYFERHQEVVRSAYWGQFTLPSLSTMLKIMPSGTDTSFGYVYLGGQANAASNVYTFFLAPLMDFGMEGMFLISFIVGLVYSRFYYKGIRGRRMDLKLSCRLCFFAFIYWIIPLAFYLNGLFFIIAPTGLISLICFYLIFTFMFKVK